MIPKSKESLKLGIHIIW